MLDFQYYWPILRYFLTSLHIAAGFLILLLTSHGYIFCSGIMFPLAQEFTFILCVCVCASTWVYICEYLFVVFPSLCKDKVLLAQILFLFFKQRSRLFFVVVFFFFFFFFVFSLLCLQWNLFGFLFPGLYELPFLTFFRLWFLLCCICVFVRQ